MFIKKITHYEYPDGMPIYKITRSTVYILGIPFYRSIKKPNERAISMIKKHKVDIELPLN
jgi:hypothetical protein